MFVAIILERAGFNNFTIIDCDAVEASNLIRQFPYNDEDIGKLFTKFERVGKDKKQVSIYEERV